MRERILEVLSADYFCTPAQLLDDGVQLFEMPPAQVSGRRDSLGRRYVPQTDPAFAVTSLGRGAVIAASAEWLPWVAELCEGKSRDELFEARVLGDVSARVRAQGQGIYGPQLRFALAPGDQREPAAISGYSVECSDARGLAGLEHDDWPNAIGRRPAPDRPNRISAVARHEGEVVGVAAVSADAAQLWQIGIDVMAAHRGRGLGAWLTGEAARATLEYGAVPYYSVVPGNLPSIRTALSVGFWPAWVEVLSTGPEVQEPRAR